VLTAVTYALVGGADFGTNEVVTIALLCAMAVGGGLYVGSKRTSITALEERASRLARERELLAERAVAEERVRIAQELHDVIAHNLSLIVVQAQALGATAGNEHVACATEDIAELGRRTMAEMHRTLRLLRARDDAPEFAPQPGLDDLGGLLTRASAAGLNVELTVEGAPRRLAQSIDLSAYRIVQEALTNTLKHAGASPTGVHLRWADDELELEIWSDELEQRMVIHEDIDEAFQAALRVGQALERLGAEPQRIAAAFELAQDYARRLDARLGSPRYASWLAREREAGPSFSRARNS
jgi:signal transduction histidine kinase